jgi:hypothetical protein
MVLKGAIDPEKDFPDLVKNGLPAESVAVWRRKYDPTKMTTARQHYAGCRNRIGLDNRCKSCDERYEKETAGSVMYTGDISTDKGLELFKKRI